MNQNLAEWLLIGFFLVAFWVAFALEGQIPLEGGFP